MVQVSYGGVADFNALMYGPKHPGTMQFLQNQVQQISDFSTTLTDAGRGFVANARRLYDELHSDEALRLARAAVRRIGNVFQRDEIKSIWELAQLQNAPLTMQRWIMAEPTVRELYHQQRCDGYSDTYVDMYPGEVKDAHYDYRRVMNGVVTEDSDGASKFTIFLDELVEGDRELTFDEKIDILNTWDIVSSLIKEGSDDPTSPWGGKL